MVVEIEPVENLAQADKTIDLCGIVVVEAYKDPSFRHGQLG
jgi:hypothetical protein